MGTPLKFEFDFDEVFEGIKQGVIRELSETNFDEAKESAINQIKSEVKEKLALTYSDEYALKDEIKKEIKERVFDKLIKDIDDKYLEQFEGYFDLKEVLIEEYDENDWPIRPGILKTTKTSETQIIKQADVVMLLHLLGEEFDEETTRQNYSYYEKRTMHGSSLSPSIYAIMGLKVGDTSKAYRYLRRAAFLDLVDLQGNTREGIHAANAGGVWQTVIFGFAGLRTDHDGTLHINPALPGEWKRLSFRIHCPKSWLEVEINDAQQVSVTVLEGEDTDIFVREERITARRKKS